MKKCQDGSKAAQNLRDAKTGANQRPIFDKSSPVTPLPGRAAKNMPKSGKKK